MRSDVGRLWEVVDSEVYHVKLRAWLWLQAKSELHENACGGARRNVAIEETRILLILAWAIHCLIGVSTI